MIPSVATVLVIDDEASIRETLRMVLEEEGGYHVLEACDGPTGRELLERHPTPLIVLIDLLMPQVSGAEILTEAVRTGNPRLRRHAYIMMTAGADRIPAPVRGALATMGAPILSKPFDIEMVLELVERVAAQRTPVM